MNNIDAKITKRQHFLKVTHDSLTRTQDIQLCYTFYYQSALDVSLF